MQWSLIYEVVAFRLMSRKVENIHTAKGSFDFIANVYQYYPVIFGITNRTNSALRGYEILTVG